MLTRLITLARKKTKEAQGQGAGEEEYGLGSQEKSSSQERHHISCCEASGNKGVQVYNP